jgi:hypothetical protein
MVLLFLFASGELSIMIFYNNGLKRGWYHHHVAGWCDNCDQGFNEGELVMNTNTRILEIFCYNCYNIVAFQTPENKKWIKSPRTEN